MGWFSRKKVETTEKALNSVDDSGWTKIFDWKPGAWQQNAAYNTDDTVLAFYAIFSCITLISNDIGKLRPMVLRKQGAIWVETDNNGYPVLKKPNGFQNHIQFKQYWMHSKLINGNTYALKVRRGQEVVQLMLLDPQRVTPLVSDEGEVFYRLNEDKLSGLDEGQVVVPASEIIHDRINCLYHPLVGLSPVYAAGTSASMALSIQKGNKGFFDNNSNPGGVLTAPGEISSETANRLKEYWDANYSGKNSGKVAVLGDGLKFEPMRMSNTDAQMMDQLRWSAEVACSVFHVPCYMIGVGPMPTHNNIEALTQQYYGQCLQSHIEAMELALDEGLDMSDGMRTQLDLDGLFRMDTATQVETLGKAVGSAIMAPDEARERLNLGKVPGGEYPYLQQQNYSLEALAARDATNPLAAEPAPTPAEPTDDDMAEEARFLGYLVQKELTSGCAET
jgi:HK97 family phage portal protein